jgi:hypothetical protein
MVAVVTVMMSLPLTQTLPLTLVLVMMLLRLIPRHANRARAGSKFGVALAVQMVLFVTRAFAAHVALVVPVPMAFAAEVVDVAFWVLRCEVVGPAGGIAIGADGIGGGVGVGSGRIIVVAVGAEDLLDLLHYHVVLFVIGGLILVGLE